MPAFPVRLLIVLAVPLLPLGTHAQRARRPPADPAPTYAARITPAALRQDLTVLASDAYEGRATGRRGQQQAAAYLARAFAAAGLRGPVAGSDTPYYQRFTLTRTGVDSASSVTVGTRTFRVNQDFFVLLRNPAAAAAVIQPTFVGYGISTPGFADYTPSDPALQAKDLVLLLDEPRNPAGQPLLSPNGQASAYAQPGFAEMLARSPAMRTLAPHATFRIMPSAAALAQVPQAYADLPGWEPRIAFPDGPAPAPAAGANVFFVSPEMGAALLGTTEAGLAAYQQQVAAAGKPVASPFRPPAVTLQVREQTQRFPTENVLGYLEGTDKKEEVVVISAHYDHVGRQHGQVYNGADDDGSGTVSVLAMARAFAQAKREGHGPRRSLLFVGFTGEELGLLGSRYYTDHPVFPLTATVANLHLDMVGRVDSLHQQGDYLYLLGSNWLSGELHELSEQTNGRHQPLQLDYRYNTLTHPAYLYYRSDHYNFARQQVPVIYYFSGFHPDYHQPGDDVDKIDFAALTRRSQLIFRTAWAVATAPQRPRPDPARASPGFQPTAPELDRYAGRYSCPQLPLTITLSRVGETLQAQPTGQPAFVLRPVRPNVFRFEPTGGLLEFEAGQSRFVLVEGCCRFAFSKP
ncbi:M28 family peptidase [Microvirga sp. STR05]|uniref:M28 family peptidase n=1 Tax=Hymenobacter duratus TaxID=2771356 RepID=A0ABR8JL82_9BACT|nr:M28 family peptidase [Hymenobacter duratus]MBD2715299.1 M28 family peptidase [Hymenobacter duratus]MBR7950206.1 M28 family peptidase [Microvirga sp. STR05]